MARRPVYPWPPYQQPYYAPPMMPYGYFLRPMVPYYYQPFAPAMYGRPQWPYHRPSSPIMRARMAELGEEDASERNAHHLGNAYHLRPPVYHQPQWAINLRMHGPPRPTKSDERSKTGKPKIEFACQKNSGLRLSKKSYFLGYASPAALTVADMENIPDLACSVWDSSQTGNSSSVSTNPFNRPCVHFDMVRRKRTNRSAASALR